MDKKNILITGSDGFIGGELFRYFTEKGHDVFGTVFRREPEANEARIDIREAGELEKIPDREYDCIINTVGTLEHDIPVKKIFEINAGCTKNILEWAGNGRCRHFIQTSSIGVYGYRTMGENRTESGTKRYHGRFAIPYMRSKALAERYIEESGVPCTILRLPAVLGKNDTFLSPTIISFMMRKDFQLYGRKDRKVSILYVKNLGPIIEELIAAGPRNDHFNCADFHMTWNEFTGEYARLLNSEIPVKRRSGLHLLFTANKRDLQLIITYSLFGSHFPTEKLASVISLKPSFPWKEGVREAVEFYRDRN